MQALMGLMAEAVGGVRASKKAGAFLVYIPMDYV